MKTNPFGEVRRQPQQHHRIRPDGLKRKPKQNKKIKMQQISLTDKNATRNNVDNGGEVLGNRLKNHSK